MPADRFRAYHEDGRVLVETDLSDGRTAEFDSEEPVAKVVFYAGPQETETVCGEQTIPADGNTGSITAVYDGE